MSKNYVLQLLHGPSNMGSLEKSKHGKGETIVVTREWGDEKVKTDRLVHGQS